MFVNAFNRVFMSVKWKILKIEQGIISYVGVCNKNHDYEKFIRCQRSLTIIKLYVSVTNFSV